MKNKRPGLRPHLVDPHRRRASTVDQAFDPTMAFSDDRIHWQWEKVGRQVVEFDEKRIMPAERRELVAHS